MRDDRDSFDTGCAYPTTKTIVVAHGGGPARGRPQAFKTDHGGGTVILNMSRIYTLYVNGTVSANAVASVTILKNARIKSVRWSMYQNSITDDALFYGEVSLLNAAQSAVNDTIGILSVFRTCNNLLTSGMTNAFVKCQDFIDCPVQVQQQVYFNAVIAGTISWAGTIQLDCTA